MLTAVYVYDLSRIEETRYGSRVAQARRNHQAAIVYTLGKPWPYTLTRSVASVAKETPLSAVGVPRKHEFDFLWNQSAILRMVREQDVKTRH